MQTKDNRVDILGVQVSAVDIPQAVNRIKRAIEEAPREKPESRGSTFEEILSASVPKADIEVINVRKIPSRARPTTLIPITLPPEKETFSASVMFFMAALVVREFAAVATFIPIKPARAEQAAPRTKARACHLKVLRFPTARNTATTRINGMSTRYSLVKNAMAPSAT